eukprot:TRINITY_DN369_c0_g3_i1.p1 TRINITY_DN369_c0_g3~~TRINITY_DN369_c0_g3_i1.p1  ORF type:complete len:967 (+),score=347.31 TRINITY_DN369_c0_g3_i1:99-2999(+)
MSIAQEERLPEDEEVMEEEQDAEMSEGGEEEPCEDQEAVEEEAEEEQAAEDEVQQVAGDEEMEEEAVDEEEEEAGNEEQQADEEEEEEVQEVQEPADEPQEEEAVEAAAQEEPAAEEGEEMEEEEGEEEAEEAENGEASEAEEPSSALVAVLPDEDTAAAQQQIVVASDGGFGGGGSWTQLPPEVNGQWTVGKDVCSLNILGSVMKLPRSVHSRLYHYQRQGVAWMWNLYHKTFGGILADEMGLGKTVQVAAFLASLKVTNQGSRFLVVVPVTLIEQWRREFNSWAGDTGLQVNVLHGSNQERRTALRKLAKDGGVLLTSYDMVRNHVASLRYGSLDAAQALQSKKRKKTVKRGVKDDDSPSEDEGDIARPAPGSEGAELPWDVIIVDEAHQIKNPSCVAGKDLRRIHSRSRFLLTGTPLQNKLIDLWAVMDLAQPGLLGNHATFERDFSEQIARGSKKNASAFAVELKDNLARQLKGLVAPHFLRRIKSEVCMKQEALSGQPSDADMASQPKELPSKSDVVLWLNLTPAQTELYNMYLKSDVVRRATGAGKCGMEALRAIALLKKLCNSPLLCLPQEEYESWRARTTSQAASAAAKRQRITPPTSGEVATSSSSSAAASTSTPAILDSQGDEDATQPAPECHSVLKRVQALVPSSVEGASLLSCKLRVLSVLLPQLQRRGHRCLIFSQSTRMLDLVQACVLRVLGLKFLRIDGSIDPKDRDLKVTKFQQPDSRYFAMCLSTLVGGVGLTITGADRVILVDPAWNPAMDAQAIDRVHRLGQTKDVVVYRLIGAGSIEDKMFRLQVFKRSLAKTVMEQEQQLRFFSHKELKSLFEAPSQAASTQTLMAEQLGTEALEHEDLLQLVASDVGGTDDAQALAFWQSSDVLGFSDYDKLFMYLEQAQKSDDAAVDVQEQARALTEKLRNEKYAKDQVVDGKFTRKAKLDDASKENVAPTAELGMMPVLQDA